MYILLAINKKIIANEKLKLKIKTHSLKLIATSKLSKDYIFWINTHLNKEWYIYHTKDCTQLQGPINYNQKWYPCQKEWI